MKIRVYIKPRQDVQDPQNNMVYQTLVDRLGFETLIGVNVGRVVELIFDDTLSKEEALLQADRMCSLLLVNPVMEDADIEWVEEPCESA